MSYAELLRIVADQRERELHEAGTIRRLVRQRRAARALFGTHGLRDNA